MAAITRLSLDGYGAKRAGSFAGKEESAAVEPAPAATSAPSGYRFTPGYIAPRRKKKRVEEPSVVEIFVEKTEAKTEVKSIVYRQVETPSFQPIVAAVQEVTRLIEAQARSAEVKRKIEELEEEEDIIAIIRLLQ
jgi:hypothetical protein